MDSGDLRPWQARKIFNTLRPGMGYLSTLKARMEKTGFPHDDKLFLKVVAAHAAMHTLYIELHYLSCGGGAGRKGR